MWSVNIMTYTTINILKHRTCIHWFHQTISPPPLLPTAIILPPVCLPQTSPSTFRSSQKLCSTKCSATELQSPLTDNWPFISSANITKVVYNICTNIGQSTNELIALESPRTRFSYPSSNIFMLWVKTRKWPSSANASSAWVVSK